MSIRGHHGTGDHEGDAHHALTSAGDQEPMQIAGLQRTSMMSQNLSRIFSGFFAADPAMTGLRALLGAGNPHKKREPIQEGSLIMRPKRQLGGIVCVDGQSFAGP